MVAALLTKDTRPPRRENFARMMESDFTPVHRQDELNRNADFFSRWARYKEYEDEQKMKIHALNSLVLKDLQRWRLDRRKPRREICIRPKNKRILHCFALNTELQRILNDEPTEEEKKQHEIEKAYRDEQKAVDDEHFAITFIPDSSEANRVRATLIQEQRKDPFLSMIIDKLLTAEAVGKQLAQKQSDARSPRTSNQVFVNSKEDTEMIDLTMDDEEKADGDAHAASDGKHTKLSSNATSSQRGVVMKIEVEDAADGSKRRRIMHSNALGAIMQIHVEDAADGSKRRRITHANTRTRSSPVPNNVLTPNVGSRATATAVKASNDATRCAATRREVNVHTSSTSSMTSTGVQVQPTVVEATAGAHMSSAVADTGGNKVKRRRRQRKNDTTPSHVVMVITDETVEERKQRLASTCAS